MNVSISDLPWGMHCISQDVILKCFNNLSVSFHGIIPELAAINLIYKDFILHWKLGFSFNWPIVFLVVEFQCLLFLIWCVHLSLTLRLMPRYLALFTYSTVESVIFIGGGTSDVFLTRQIYWGYEVYCLLDSAT